MACRSDAVLGAFWRASSGLQQGQSAGQGAGAALLTLHLVPGPEALYSTPVTPTCAPGPFGRKPTSGAVWQMCDTPLIGAQKCLAEAKAASPGSGPREGRSMPSWRAGPGRGTSICGLSPRHSPTACASTQPWRKPIRRRACMRAQGLAGSRGFDDPRPAIPGEVIDFTHSIAPGLKNSRVHLFPAAVCLQTHGLCNRGSVIACFSSSSTSGPRSGHNARAVCR